MSAWPPPLPPGHKVRNPQTYRQYRKEVFWQIGVPLGLAGLGVLLVMGWLVGAASYPTLSVWADISLIGLICPAASMGIVVLAVLVGCTYGLYLALRELPPVLKQAQDLMRLVAVKVQGYAAQVAEVFVAGGASWAAGAKAVDATRKKFTPGTGGGGKRA